MTVRSHIALIPRDGFFCKDGRGWHTSTSGRGHALDWPWPSTILGALRTASGRAKEAARALTSSEWQQHARSVSLHRLLALRREVVAAAPWGPEHRVWSVPADALWLEGKAGGRRLVPLLPEPMLPDPPTAAVRTLGRETNGHTNAQAVDRSRESLWWPRVADQAKPLAAPRWWSEADFVAWLAGDRAKVATDPPRWAEKPLRRVQARVGIDAETFTAAESVLFSHDVIETLDRLGPSKRAAEWAIGAEVDLPAAFGAGLVRLGSDSRVAHVEVLAETAFATPPGLIEAFDSKRPAGLRLVVVTPAKFQNGWLPSGFEVRGGEFHGQIRGISGEFRLRAALVPRPLHVSGWNMVGGGNDEGRSGSGGAPKETSRLVPPGAVFFFERLDRRPFDADDARKLWLAALGARTDEGFGRVVPGIWDPSERGPKE